MQRALVLPYPVFSYLDEGMRAWEEAGHANTPDDARCLPKGTGVKVDICCLYRRFCLRRQQRARVGESPTTSLLMRNGVFIYCVLNIANGCS